MVNAADRTGEGRRTLALVRRAYTGSDQDLGVHIESLAKQSTVLGERVQTLSKLKADALEACSTMAPDERCKFESQMQVELLRLDEDICSAQNQLRECGMTLAALETILASKSPLFRADQHDVSLTGMRVHGVGRRLGSANTEGPRAHSQYGLYSPRTPRTARTNVDLKHAQRRRTRIVPAMIQNALLNQHQSGNSKLSQTPEFGLAGLAVKAQVCDELIEPSKTRLQMWRRNS